jgi:outer membrane cobalamin receptor
MPALVWAVVWLAPLPLWGQAASTPADAKTQTPAPVSSPVKATETVVVTATFEPIPLEQTNRSVQVLDTLEAPLLYNAVTEYLQLDPSIDLQARAPGGVQTDLNIRGTTFEQSLVLLNGMRINDEQTGHHDMDLPVPLEALSRIEVLHGAGSIFYGSDAMGGAVNLITAAPAHDEAIAAGGFGSYGINDERFVGSLMRGIVAARLAASRDFSTGFIYDRDYRAETASPEFWLTTPLGQTDILLAGSDRAFGANQFYGDYPSWERTKGWFASVQQPFLKTYSAAFAYRRHTDEFVLFRDDPAIYENNHIDQSWQGILRGASEFKKNTTLSYGLEENADEINSNNLGHHGRNYGAGYLNIDVRSLGRFSLTVGGREEVLSGGQSVFVPNLSAGAWLGHSFRLRASGSHAFRLPTYTDLYYSDPATLGNSLLQPETSWDAEGGLEWHPDGRLSGEATLFYSHEHDVIDYAKLTPVTPTELWQAENIPTLNFTGVEAAVHLRLSAGQRIDFGYMGLHGSPLSPVYSYEYASHYANSNANVAWNGVFCKQVQARMRVQMVQRYQQTAYPLWDAAISRANGRVRPYLQFLNLSNTGYQEITGVQMPGRTVIGGVEFAFSRDAHAKQ